MKAKGQVINPDSVIVAITVEMEVRQWNALVSKLPSDWPCWKFSSLVTKVLNESLSKVEHAHEAQE